MDLSTHAVFRQPALSIDVQSVHLPPDNGVVPECQPTTNSVIVLGPASALVHAVVFGLAAGLTFLLLLRIIVL